MIGILQRETDVPRRVRMKVEEAGRRLDVHRHRVARMNVAIPLQEHVTFLNVGPRILVREEKFVTLRDDVMRVH